MPSGPGSKTFFPENTPDMELRTTFSIDPSPVKISYTTPVLFIGSCFATAVGSHLREGKLPVMVNPAGTVYNPFSVGNTLNSIISPAERKREELYGHGGRWISFDHHTEFSSDDREELLEKIKAKEEEARNFLSGAGFLFITFGTARVYRWKETGRIVSNCHRIPASFFRQELLTPEEIASFWSGLLDRLGAFNPGLKVIFTISPVRHWKDGAHGNQVSKSVLFLAVEKLMAHPSSPDYFPVYELVMDDLRDYRFYGADMLHLSDTAVEYIRDAFDRCYVDDTARELWNEVAGITKAAEHRILTGDSNEIRRFAENMLAKITRITRRYPSLNLGGEADYFRGLLSGPPAAENQ